MTLQDVLAHIKNNASPAVKASRERFGIDASIQTHGITWPQLRALGKTIGKNHELAQELWDSGIYEARLLATVVDDYTEVTQAQMERWVRDFNSWEIVDQCCGNLFDKTPFAFDKAQAWVHDEAEFVRRTGFALMATLSVHAKKATDAHFEPFFPLIEQYAFDNRNFVKKAVNWALRQMGKRNQALYRQAVECAQRVSQQQHPSARWIAADALRELKSPQVLKRIAERVHKI